MRVKSESEVAQSCPTLRDARDCSPTGSPVQGIFQARVLEWGQEQAIAFSTGSSWEKFYSFQSVPYMTARVIFSKYML